MRKLTSFIYVVLVGIAVVGLTTSASRAAAILNVSGGQLLGADNVNIGGTLFNVDFVDGTCIAIFGGCDAVTDFDFATPADAQAAAQALLDQVFLDGVLGLFDTDPELTAACNNVNSCDFFIPFAFTNETTVRACTALNRNETSPFDGICDDDGRLLAAADDLGVGARSSFRAFATFTPAPEPATILVFGAGLLGLAGLRRRRRSR